MRFFPSTRTPSFRLKRSVEFVKHETSVNGLGGDDGALSAVLVGDDVDMLVRLLDVDMLTEVVVDGTAAEAEAEAASPPEGGSSMTGLAVGRTDMPHACSRTVGGLSPIILVLDAVDVAVAVAQAADCCPE